MSLRMNANRGASLSGADPAERIEGPRRTLVLGGVRSGKSRFAESLARASRLPVTFIATARALDGEMRERIAVHRNRRSADWRLVEEPIALAETLARECLGDHCCLVECH
jgi:adenosylcobinamide kinase/adenosylcobinamide-phosphate guanylyltransferase